MTHKYNSVLQQQADEENDYQKKQDKLKEKFGIEGQDVVVVERTNTFKFTMNMLISVLCLVAKLAICTLAFIGALALCYPEPRAEVFIILEQALVEISNYIPIGELIH